MFFKTTHLLTSRHIFTFLEKRFVFNYCKRYYYFWIFIFYHWDTFRWRRGSRITRVSTPDRHFIHRIGTVNYFYFLNKLWWRGLLRHFEGRQFNNRV